MIGEVGFDRIVARTNASNVAVLYAPVAISDDRVWRNDGNSLDTEFRCVFEHCVATLVGAD